MPTKVECESHSSREFGTRCLLNLLEKYEGAGNPASLGVGGSGTSHLQPTNVLPHVQVPVGILAELSVKKFQASGMSTLLCTAGNSELLRRSALQNPSRSLTSSFSWSFPQESSLRAPLRDELIETSGYASEVIAKHPRCTDRHAELCGFSANKSDDLKWVRANLRLAQVLVRTPCLSPTITAQISCCSGARLCFGEP